MSVNLQKKVTKKREFHSCIILDEICVAAFPILCVVLPVFVSVSILSRCDVFGEGDTKPCLKCSVTFRGLADECYDQYFTLRKRNGLQGDLTRSRCRCRQGQHNVGRTLQMEKIALDEDFCEKAFPAFPIKQEHETDQDYTHSPEKKAV
ncbi:MAG: hypothetical protein H6Q55_2605 [Deltaproteobacteria bacterium]|nr:hypothetical protein [Deltaproteobacteria bacterium]